MNFTTFTREEKKATLKSALLIANADGNINYSEDLYLGTLVVLMDGDNSLAKEASNMWKMEMRKTIRNMSLEKKNIVKNVWIQTMSKARGGTLIGNVSVNSNTSEGQVILNMAEECGIDVDGFHTV